MSSYRDVTSGSVTSITDSSFRLTLQLLLSLHWYMSKLWLYPPAHTYSWPHSKAAHRQLAYSSHLVNMMSHIANAVEVGKGNTPEEKHL